MRYLTLCLTAMILSSSFAMADDTTAEQKRDQIRIAVQKVCPVSGEKLGSHGDPVKVIVGPKEEEIFLCCEACLAKEIDGKLWGKIHRNIAKAQSICPVMKKELPADAEWTIVEGQIVYVCCPPCTGKIERDPATYLSQVDQFYQKSIKK